MYVHILRNFKQRKEKERYKVIKWEKRNIYTYTFLAMCTYIVYANYIYI